jgi:hypothetical protein
MLSAALARAHRRGDHDAVESRRVEFIGTFWLVLAGRGSAVLAAAFPQLGIGFVGVAFVPTPSATSRAAT